MPLSYTVRLPDLGGVTSPLRYTTIHIHSINGYTYRTPQSIHNFIGIYIIMYIIIYKIVLAHCSSVPIQDRT